MSGIEKHSHRDYSKFNNLSTEELEEILRLDSLLPDDKNRDLDLVLYVMDELVRRDEAESTGKYDVDIESKFKYFEQNYLPYADTGISIYEDDNDDISANEVSPPTASKKLRRSIRVALIAAATIAALLATSLVAYAFGYDIFGAIAGWTKDTFSFSSISDGDYNHHSSSSTEDIEFEDLQGALDAYGISEKLSPTWIPERYTFMYVEVADIGSWISFDALYFDESNSNPDYLTISVVFRDSDSLSYSTYEKDDGEVYVFEYNNIQHYIMSNLVQTNIVWLNNNAECCISGTFSFEEIEQIIISIYER